MTFPFTAAAPSIINIIDGNKRRTRGDGSRRSRGQKKCEAPPAAASCRGRNHGGEKSGASADRPDKLPIGEVEVEMAVLPMASKPANTGLPKMSKAPGKAIVKAASCGGEPAARPARRKHHGLHRQRCAITPYMQVRGNWRASHHDNKHGHREPKSRRCIKA